MSYIYNKTLNIDIQFDFLNEIPILIAVNQTNKQLTK